MSTEEYSQKIIGWMDQVLIDLEADVWNHQTEWHLRQLPKWRAYSLARIGAKLGAIPPDWMTEFEDEVMTTPGHRLRQIENPYTMTLKSEYTIEEPS